MACRLVGTKPLSEQCWNIVNSNLRIFIHKIAFENVVCEMAAICFRPQCFNSTLKCLQAAFTFRPVAFAGAATGDWFMCDGAMQEPLYSLVLGNGGWSQISGKLTI